MSVDELQERLVALWAEIASFHTSCVMRLIMEARQVSGRESFKEIYRDFGKAIYEVGCCHGLLDSTIGFVAHAITKGEYGNMQFNTALDYFEGNQAGLGIPPEEIEYYVNLYGCDSGIRTLDSFCLNALIRTSRMIERVLIQKNTPVEKRSMSMEICFQAVLKNEDFGFIGLFLAVRNLLESGAGEKALFELNSEKLIEQDMAAFRKSRNGH